VVTRTVDDGVELWHVDVATGASRRLLPAILNDVLGGAASWLASRDELLVRLRVDGGRAAPGAPTVPLGPVVEDTSGKQATNRTYQDLLKDAQDEALFEHYFTCQLARLPLFGEPRPIGEPGILIDAGASPDGGNVLVERVVRPFSYQVPLGHFAKVIEVYDEDGRRVADVARLPVADEIPIQGVPAGPRGLHWQPHAPATLCYAFALDGGDPRRAAAERDEVRLLERPFRSGSEIHALGRTKHRFVGLEWLERPGRCLVTEWDRDRRWLSTTLRDAIHGGEPRVVFDRSQNDRYGDPGEPVLRRLADGSLVARMEGDAIFLAGDGATPAGDRPFLDRFDLETFERTRIFESGEGHHATFVQFAPSVAGALDRFLVRRESRREPPNFHLRERGNGAERPLTTFPDPHPELTGIEKELLHYERGDGVKLSGTLYLPPSRSAGEKLPLVVWAYPREFNDAATAGQVSAQPNRFTRLAGTSPLLFLLRGFAVLDDATVPIVGDPETVNDTFIPQTVESASAAIDAAAAHGAIDRDRVAVGGHSYGAFMTVNLLAHCDLFRAGIARSGAYNRTLTPFGFQGERRTMWEAQAAYLAMSPLLHADRIKSPLLLIHGEIDDNPGTHTLQTRRLFHALAGLGATARMVILPHEAHGYVAAESVLHVLAESIEWLERHLAPRSPIQ
jgi:dipeptidyl aminopeptidase/acylaminoacyl peptidase